MNLRRFTREGLAQFQKLLDALRADPLTPVPDTLLSDPTMSVELSPPVSIEKRTFANRMELGAYLHQLLEEVDPNIHRDSGLWAWMTLLYFDQVCPKNDKGERAVGAQSAKWIPRMDLSRRFYRHCLLGPYLAYRSHRHQPEEAAVLLADPLHVTTSEAFRLFIETPFVNIASPVALATQFYYDPNKGKLRRGVGVKGAGGMRRYLQVLQQLDLTYDLHSLPVDRLRDLLPSEFNKWKNHRELFS